MMVGCVANVGFVLWNLIIGPLEMRCLSETRFEESGERLQL